ncbi:hypothetical protein Chor_007239 [Crotalus horridus]
MLTGEGMGTPQLVYGLSLILLIQTTPSQLTDGNMMQKSGTWIRDVLQRQLETQSFKGTFTSATTLQNKSLNRSTPLFSGLARIRPKRHTWERPEEQECQLRSLLVRIKDLSLGYNSEETILFKYCSGTCPKAHSNHDLTLSILLQKSEIPALGNPCCRPIHYENVAFLDDSHQWHEVEKLSASACSCVG